MRRAMRKTANPWNMATVAPPSGLGFFLELLGGAPDEDPAVVDDGDLVSILIVVVFPAPLGPRNAKISPALTSKEMSLTAVKLPNFLTRWLTWIIEKSGASNPAVAVFFDYWSGRAESNRPLMLGKHVYYRCTTPAQRFLKVPIFLTVFKGADVDFSLADFSSSDFFEGHEIELIAASFFVEGACFKDLGNRDCFCEFGGDF